MSVSRHHRERDGGRQLMVGFQGTTLAEELKALIRDFQVGGIVIFKRNVASPEQLKTLLIEAQAYARETIGRPLWVAIDQEGGPVQRLAPPFLRLPSAREMAAGGETAVREWAARAAIDLRHLGIHINLAPVLDIAVGNESHFMTERSLGHEPTTVARLGVLWIETLQRHGISATAKHYPGLGRAKLDPHHHAPVIQWEQEEAMAADLLPFRAAIRAGVHGIMTSHAFYPALDPSWPATLSPTINRDWLRQRLEFAGILFSDDLDMAAVAGRYSFQEIVRQGLLASLDFFLLCQDTRNIEPLYRALADAVRHDQGLAELHGQSLVRMDRLGMVGAREHVA